MDWWIEPVVSRLVLLAIVVACVSAGAGVGYYLGRRDC